MFNMDIQDRAAAVTSAIRNISNHFALTTNTATALFNLYISPAVTDRIQLT
jgi:hypothetical protein